MFQGPQTEWIAVARIVSSTGLLVMAFLNTEMDHILLSVFVSAVILALRRYDLGLAICDSFILLQFIDNSTTMTVLYALELGVTLFQADYKLNTIDDINAYIH
tara:strand:+ start:342 stop:650 length:309 start_codon:yes stop_codon:yes gene_type:complete